MDDRCLQHCFLSSDNELYSGTTFVPDVHLSTLLLQRLQEHGDKILYINYVTGSSLTALEARDISLKLATYLHSRGIREDALIFGYAYNCEIYACCLLGVTCIGAIFTGCLPYLTKREVRNQLVDSKAKVILCSKATAEIAVQLADELDFVEQVIVLDEHDGEENRVTRTGKPVSPVDEIMRSSNEKNSMDFTLNKIPSEAVAAICYSSGSTGAPKGVMKTHANLVASCFNTGNFLTTVGYAGDVVSFHQPIPHIGGILFTVHSMFMGNKCIMNTRWDLQDWLTIVSRYAVTHSFIAPSYAAIASKSDLVAQYDVSSLQRIVTGGAPIAESMAEAFVQRMKLKKFKQNYGSTEVSLVTYPPDSESDNYKTCGVPVMNMRIRIAGRKTGLSLGPNKVGEVQVKGNEVTIGYYKRPDADAENFTADGWLRTGDAAYFDESGLLYIVDRYKDLIKVDTQQVAPVELESLLLNHEAVAEAAVVGVPDDVHGEIPKAFVVLKEGVPKSDVEEIMKIVNEQLSVHKKIRLIESVDSLPKISIGKIDRNSLKKRVLSSND